jgi:hypothetical protein
MAHQLGEDVERDASVRVALGVAVSVGVERDGVGVVGAPVRATQLCDRVEPLPVSSPQVFSRHRPAADGILLG